MKIATLNRTIMHKQNPAQDGQRLAAFEEAADEFMAEIAQEMRVAREELARRRAA